MLRGTAAGEPVLSTINLAQRRSTPVALSLREVGHAPEVGPKAMDRGPRLAILPTVST